MNDLTLIFLTFNTRHRLLLRSLKHYKDKTLVIYILDASATSIAVDEITASLGSTKFVYHLLPFKTVGERLHYIAGAVKTRYVALHCDDEFYSLDALAEIVNFLNDNVDYVSCMGFAIGFVEKKTVVTLHTVYPELLEASLSSPLPLERAHQLARRYSCSSFYAVNRTESWVRAISLSVRIDRSIKIFAISEYIFELAMAIEGKRRVLNKLYWFRNLGPSAEKYSDPIISVAWFLSEYKESREKMISQLGEYLDENCSYGASYARLVARELLESFVITNLRCSFNDYTDITKISVTGFRNNFPTFYIILKTLKKYIKRISHSLSRIASKFKSDFGDNIEINQVGHIQLRECLSRELVDFKKFIETEAIR